MRYYQNILLYYVSRILMWSGPSGLTITNVWCG